MYELEEKSVADRQKLMQLLFDHLKKMGLKAELQTESVVNYLGMKILEPMISIRDQNINIIRLDLTEGSGCGVSGNIMRFQYEINLGKELAGNQLENMSAVTEVIKEGKFSKLFGGKVVGTKWVGKALADRLNQDIELSDRLKQCAIKWPQVEFRVEPVSTTVVCVDGPRFYSAETVIELYESMAKENVERCIFGFNTVDRIAGYIRNSGI